MISFVLSFLANNLQSCGEVKSFYLNENCCNSSETKNVAIDPMVIDFINSDLLSNNNIQLTATSLPVLPITINSTIVGNYKGFERNASGVDSIDNNFLITTSGSILNVEYGMTLQAVLYERVGDTHVIVAPWPSPLRAWMLTHLNTYFRVDSLRYMTSTFVIGSNELRWFITVSFLKGNETGLVELYSGPIYNPGTVVNYPAYINIHKSSLPYTYEGGSMENPP